MFKFLLSFKKRIISRTWKENSFLSQFIDRVLNELKVDQKILAEVFCCSAMLGIEASRFAWPSNADLAGLVKLISVFWDI